MRRASRLWLWILPAGVGVVGVLLLSATFLLHSWRVLRDRRDIVAKRMFGVSIVYLFGLFAMLVVDKAMGLGW